MKIRIELEDNLDETEIVIKCSEIDDSISQIQNALNTVALSDQKFVLYKGDAQFYIAMKNILFFETEGNAISVHTRDDIFETRYRLYELEEMLPGHFVRVSKSTIANIKEIYSLTKSNLSTTSTIAFYDSHKEVYVSRHYTRMLKEKLEEMRSR